MTRIPAPLSPLAPSLQLDGPARDRFGYLFVTLARGWRRVIDAELARTGLTDATWTPLVHLAIAGDGISQAELAARLCLDASTLVRLVDRLSEQGLLERQPDPNDRRARRLVLTPAGAAEVTKIRNRLLEIESELLADLPDETMQVVVNALGHIEARIEARFAAPEDDAERHGAQAKGEQEA